MGQALYRKYRPKKLAEAVGQGHITSVLSKAIDRRQLSHAYLLTGPRGVGKTSIARILAHEINALEYDGTAHLDIIEIDAASNRRIDEIRDLRDRVNIAPSSAKYKVYIIDEVHMLTKEAFNALLKTLEEPPAHVIFILATTEAHKLPDTIISRTQHFSFRPVPETEVADHLKSIARQEKIAIDDDALRLVARHGGGSFRDSIGLLDQLAAGGTTVTKQTVEQLLGIVSDELISQLIGATESGDMTSVIELLVRLQGQGYEPARIAQQIAGSIRMKLLEGQPGLPTPRALNLLKELLAVPAARDQMALLELTLLGAAVADSAATPLTVQVQPTVMTAPARSSAKTEQPTIQAQTPDTDTSKQTKTASAPAASQAAPAKASKPTKLASETPSATTEDPSEAKNENETVPSVTLEIDITDIWKQVLNDIKQQYNTLYGIARMAKPTLQGQTLTLAFTFAFHQKRVNEAKNRKLLAETVSRLSGQAIEIVCTVEAKPSTTPADKPQDLTAISTIFGGGELLES